MEAPLSLELEVTSSPRCTIKTTGASVAVNAIVNVLVLPPGQPPVQLSSMTMVSTPLLAHNVHTMPRRTHIMHFTRRSIAALMSACWLYLQETKFNAKVAMKGKRLTVHMDLRRSHDPKLIIFGHWHPAHILHVFFLKSVVVFSPLTGLKSSQTNLRWSH